MILKEEHFFLLFFCTRYTVRQVVQMGGREFKHKIVKK